jgi:hypothetical protein
MTGPFERIPNSRQQLIDLREDVFSVTNASQIWHHFFGDHLIAVISVRAIRTPDGRKKHFLAEVPLQFPTQPADNMN